MYAIEPQTRLQPILRHNISINRFDDSIRLIHKALSDSTGSAILNLMPLVGSSGLFRTGVTFRAKSEVATTTTIDEIVCADKLTRIRLLKVDVEGAEHLVVKGAHDTLRHKRVDILALEYHPTIGGGTVACSETHSRLLEYGYLLAEFRGQTIYHLPEYASLVRELEADLPQGQTG